MKIYVLTFFPGMDYGMIPICDDIVLAFSSLEDALQSRLRLIEELGGDVKQDGDFDLEKLDIPYIKANVTELEVLGEVVTPTVTTTIYPVIPERVLYLARKEYEEMLDRANKDKEASKAARKAKKALKDKGE